MKFDPSRNHTQTEQSLKVTRSSAIVFSAQRPRKGVSIEGNRKSCNTTEGPLSASPSSIRSRHHASVTSHQSAPKMEHKHSRLYHQEVPL